MQPKARHLEFNRLGRALAVMSFENPAVSYCLLDTNQYIGKTIARDSSSSKFYTMMQEIILWKKVNAIPDCCDEWYHVQISILGRTCVIDIEIGRRSCTWDVGYLKVNYIDDTDKFVIDSSEPE